MKSSGVIRIHRHAEADLVQVGIARNRPRALFGRAQRRQKHRRENGDDGDDDEQFNQRERPRAIFIFGKNVHARLETENWRRGFNYVSAPEISNHPPF
jgi:hypothetical protein